MGERRVLEKQQLAEIRISDKRCRNVKILWKKSGVVVLRESQETEEVEVRLRGTYGKNLHEICLCEDFCSQDNFIKPKWRTLYGIQSLSPQEIIENCRCSLFLEIGI